MTTFRYTANEREVGRDGFVAGALAGTGIGLSRKLSPFSISKGKSALPLAALGAIAGSMIGRGVGGAVDDAKHYGTPLTTRDERAAREFKKRYIHSGAVANEQYFTEQAIAQAQAEAHQAAVRTKHASLRERAMAKYASGAILTPEEMELGAHTRSSLRGGQIGLGAGALAAMASKSQKLRLPLIAGGTVGGAIAGGVADIARVHGVRRQLSNERVQDDRNWQDYWAHRAALLSGQTTEKVANVLPGQHRTPDGHPRVKRLFNPASAALTGAGLAVPGAVIAAGGIHLLRNSPGTVGHAAKAMLGAKFGPRVAKTMIGGGALLGAGTAMSMNATHREAVDLARLISDRRENRDIEKAANSQWQPQQQQRRRRPLRPFSALPGAALGTAVATPLAGAAYGVARLAGASPLVTGLATAAPLALGALVGATPAASANRAVDVGTQIAGGVSGAVAAPWNNRGQRQPQFDPRTGQWR